MAPEIEPAVARKSRRRNARRLFLWRRPSMSKAMVQIVVSYVRLNNRRGLEDLRTHRQKLSVDLKGRAGYDFSLPIGQIDKEFAVIEAGLDRLNASS
jgi:hypothetical protein